MLAAWSNQDFWRSAHIAAGSGAGAWGDGTEVDSEVLFASWSGCLGSFGRAEVNVGFVACVLGVSNDL